MEAILANPANPPYEGPFSIPILIDDIKELPPESRGESALFSQSRQPSKEIPSGSKGFYMTRCTYFFIEAEKSKDDWFTILRSRQIPFLLMGNNPVLHRPNLEQPYFEKSRDIDQLLDGIEEVEDLLVESSHIWLANSIIYKCRQGREAIAPRGEVLRIAFGLFQQALKFQEGSLDQQDFESICEAAREGDLVQFMDKETAVFREWSSVQIQASMDNYQKQRTDGRGVLDWRDDKGAWNKG